RLAQELDERGAQRAFVITTRSVASNPALGGALAQLLGPRAVGQYSAISQHAPAASVAAATRAAAESKPDLLISFGGGSPIDAAQLALHTPLELWLTTGIRSVDHAVETLLAPGSHPLPDTLALDALRRLRASLLATRTDPTDLAARNESQLGAWFSFTLPGPAAGGLSHPLGNR